MENGITGSINVGLKTGLYMKEMAVEGPSVGGLLIYQNERNACAEKSRNAVNWGTFSRVSRQVGC